MRIERRNTLPHVIEVDDDYCPACGADWQFDSDNTVFCPTQGCEVGGLADAGNGIIGCRSCTHRDESGEASAEDMDTYSDGDECRSCGMTLRAGWWYIEDPETQD